MPKTVKQQGFSLIEVLIALIIMSVGMLGIAGLYVQSLQAGRTSMFRHQAVALAGDVADRIRANPRAGTAYSSAGNTGCNPEQPEPGAAAMAEYDVIAWQQQADDTLPGSADVIVELDDCKKPPLYTITVSWEEPGITGPDKPSYVVKVPVNPF